MQRRDVETDGQGGGAGRGTTSGKHRDISTAHAVCSLRSALCSLQSVGGLQQMRRFPNCRLLFVSFFLLPLPACLAVRVVPCPFCSLLFSLIQLQHIRCQHAPQTLPRSSDWPSMPSQDHSSSMRLLIRRSANNQRGARNPQALGVQVASSLSCFTAAVDPAAHQTTQLQSSSRPSPSLMGFPNAATHAGSGQRRAL